MKQEIATDLATSIALGMTTGVLVTVHAPNAEDVASKLAGSMKWPIYGSGTAHTYIGNYSVATGLVTRACSTASASGTTNVAGTFSREYSEVMAEDAANPNNGDVAWNDFFGATPMTPPPDPDQQTVMYQALKFVVGEERMAARGGPASVINEHQACHCRVAQLVSSWVRSTRNFCTSVEEEQRFISQNVVSKFLEPAVPGLK